MHAWQTRLRGEQARANARRSALRRVRPALQHRTGSIVRILPGNVGYVDLDRLPLTMVDSAFRVLANTKAIVFDIGAIPLAPRGRSRRG